MSHRKQRRRRRHRRPDLAGRLALEPTAAGATPPAVLRLLGCDPTTSAESTVVRADELTIARETWPVLWIDVEGLDDPATTRMIGDGFEISDLALEDAVTPDERPKVEVFGHQVLIAARTVRHLSLIHI